MKEFARFAHQMLIGLASLVAINQFGVTPGLLCMAVLFLVSGISWLDGYRRGQEE